MESPLQKRRDARLGVDPVGKLLVHLSLPSIIGMLVHALYNFVDTIFIGRGVGPDGIGGLIIAFPFQMLIMGLAGIIGIGGSSMVSRYLGSGDRKKACRTAGSAFTMATILGLLITVLGLVFLDSLLRLFGATDVLIGYSRDYLSIILYGAFLASFGMVANNILRAEGRALEAMAILLSGTIVNLILDPIFIFVFDWGIRGAAYATVVAQCVSTSILLLFFLSGRSSLDLEFRHLKIMRSLAKEMVAIGFPSFVRQAGGSVMMVAVNNMLGKYGGDIYISSFGIVNRFFLLMFMVLFGLIQGLQPIVGYNYGAGQMERVKHALRLSITASTLFCCLVFIVLMAFPSQMVGLFSNDPQLIQIGTKAVRYVILAIPLVGFQVIAASFFQAIGKARPALLLSMSRQFILLIPLVLILPLFLGAYGVFWAFPWADFLAVLLTLYWFMKEVRELRD